MRRSLLLSAFVLLCCRPALLPAQSPAVRDLLDSRNKQIDDAFIKGDPASVTQFFTPAATIINPVGAALRPEDLFASIKHGTLKYSSIKRSEEKLALHGHLAILTFLTTDVGTVQGHDISGKYRWTEVWSELGGQWQIVAVQGTMVIPQP